MNYEVLFNDFWRGFYNCRVNSYADIEFIRASKAVTYNDLLNETIVLKKAELEKVGGKPFYEPSTYYRTFREAEYHDKYEWAAARYASGLYSLYYRFQNHSKKDQRPLPNYLEEPVKKLWTIINEVSVIEPWAWPMTQIYNDLNIDIYTKNKQIPVIVQIYEKYVALGFTEEEFLSSLQKIRELLKY